MAAFRRLSILALIIGWLDHAVSLFALPFIDILKPAKITARCFYELAIKLDDFVGLTRELNVIEPNLSIYQYSPFASVLYILIVGMLIISIVGIIYPRAIVVKGVAFYNIAVALLVTVLVYWVNSNYGVRVFINPANNIVFLAGLMFTLGSSFKVNTIINEDTKKEGFIL